MSRVSPVAAAVLLVVGTFGALPVAGMGVAGPADGGAATQVQANESVAPGERLAAVVGVQGAEIEGEVEARTFAVRVAGANSNASKASVVRDQLGAIEERLQELEAEKRELERAHENGSMSTGEYRAELAELYARNRATMELTNETEATAAGLPEETLAEKGINVTAIRTLKSDARNLTGPEVAEIARSIAGPNVGRQAVERNAPPVAGNASERGFDRAGNASERGPGDAGPGSQDQSNRTQGPPDDRAGAADNETDAGDRGGAPDRNGTDGADRGQAPDDSGQDGNETTAGQDGGDAGQDDSDAGQNSGTDGQDSDDSGQSDDRSDSSGGSGGQSG